MNLEEYFSQFPNLPSATFTRQYTGHSLLPDEARHAANHGLLIFPVPVLAKLTNPDLLINEATCDISRLEELAAEHGPCEWSIRADSAYCILRVDGKLGSNSVAALSMESQEECRTFQIRRGDTRWAVFSIPKGLVRRASVRRVASGVSILSLGDSCPIQPSKGCVCEDPGEVETAPYWLQRAAFEPLDSPPGRAVPAPKPSLRPVPCRSTVHFPQLNQDPQKGHPNCNQARWNGGYRIYRQR